MYELLGGADEAERRSRKFDMWGEMENTWWPVVRWKDFSPEASYDKIIKFFLLNESGKTPEYVRAMARRYRLPADISWGKEDMVIYGTGYNYVFPCQVAAPFWSHPEEARWVAMMMGPTTVAVEHIHFPSEPFRKVVSAIKVECPAMDYRGGYVVMKILEAPVIPSGATVMVLRDGIMVHWGTITWKKGEVVELKMTAVPEAQIGSEIELHAGPEVLDVHALTHPLPVIARVKVQRLVDPAKVQIKVTEVGGKRVKTKKIGKEKMGLLTYGAHVLLKHNFPSEYCLTGSEIRVMARAEGGACLFSIPVTSNTNQLSVKTNKVLVQLKAEFAQTAQVVLVWRTPGDFDIPIDGLFFIEPILRR